MSIMRAASGPGWLGVQNAGIKDIEDLSAKYDWADVYLQFNMNVDNSDYTRPMRITGSFEFNVDGTVKPTGLVRRINQVCDALGFDGGVNQNGKWVTADESPIEDIAAYLNEHFTNTDRPYKVYVFKEMGKNGKEYTRVHPRIFKNKPGAEEALLDYIKYMKDNGYLKESTGVAPSQNGVKLTAKNEELAKELSNFDV